MGGAVLFAVGCLAIDPLGCQQQFSLPLLLTTKNISRHRQIWGKITPRLQVFRPKHDSLLVPQKGMAGVSCNETEPHSGPSPPPPPRGDGGEVGEGNGRTRTKIMTQ